MRCDLRDPEDIAQAVAAVIEEFGRLDLLVNNAGAFASAALEEITVEQWDEMFATNTRAPFLVAQAAYPHLRDGAGPHHQYRLAGRHPSVGDARALLHVEGGAAHALADDGQGVGAGDQRQLRCAGNDRAGRGGRGLRALRAEDPHAAQRHARRMWRRRCCSSPPGRTSSPGNCWRWTAVWGSSADLAVKQCLPAQHLLPPVFFFQVFVEIQRLRLRHHRLAHKDCQWIADAEAWA